MVELMDFIKAGFNIGVYGLILYFGYHLIREAIKIIKTWTRTVRARAEKEEYVAVGEKLKVRQVLSELGIKKDEIDIELSKLSGIIENNLRKVKEDENKSNEPKE